MEISLAQRFEIERFNRVIDETEDIESLRKITKKLLHAWQLQKSATIWAYRESLPKIHINTTENEN